MTISTVTSEALQLKLRQLLPSQQGFGTDLSASNTIVPIIDLTASAEGSDVRQDLQTALAFGSQTEFNASNSTVLLANTAGFYRIVGVTAARSSPSVNMTGVLQMSDGATTKDVWEVQIPGGSVEISFSHSFDLVVYLNAGDTVSAISSNAALFLSGSIRQIATSSGTLVQPVGFTPQ
jgi:hypothetical protein